MPHDRDEPITITLPQEWADALLAAMAHRHQSRLDEILELLLELRKMSQTAQQTMDANNAATAAALDTIQTEVTTIAAELQAAIPPVGSTVSQASIDTMTANVARLTAVKASLDALIPPPVVPTV
jgi:hypothetical protein